MIPCPVCNSTDIHVPEQTTMIFDAILHGKDEVHYCNNCGVMLSPKRKAKQSDQVDSIIDGLGNI